MSNEDAERRKEFSRKLFQYTKVAGSLNPSDVIFKIGLQLFGMKQYRLALVGGGGVGKSCFVSKHVNNQFVQKYEPTHGAVVTSIVFLTNQHILIKFDVWDTAGVEKCGGLRDGYYIGSDGAVLMYDVTSKVSCDALPQMHKDLTRVCGKDIPIVCTGNKADIKQGRKVKANQGVKFSRKNGLRHIELSTKSGLNFEQPFLHLAKHLTGDKSLRFVTALGKQNPELQSGDESDVATFTSQLSLEDRPSTKQAEVAEAAALSLPPSKNDDGGL